MKIPLVGWAGFALWVLGICPASADHAGFLKLPEERQRAFKTAYHAAEAALRHPGQEKPAPWRDTLVEAGYLKK